MKTADVNQEQMKRDMEACFVMIKVPEDVWSGEVDPDARQSNLENGVYGIVLDTGDYVWITATYNEETPKGVVHVTDGRTNGYSNAGERILSVPATWCKFYTAEEAQGIMECIEADHRLLCYARG